MYGISRVSVLFSLRMTKCLSSTWQVTVAPCGIVAFPPINHWGWVTHICVSRITIIGSDNDWSPGRCQAIIWTNAGILLIRTLETNFSEILSEIHAFSSKKMHLKMSAKSRHLCPNLNELTWRQLPASCDGISVWTYPSIGNQIGVVIGNVSEIHISVITSG